MENLIQTVGQILTIYGFSIPFPQRDVHVYNHSLDADK
jgi:hypothetical protein